MKQLMITSFIAGIVLLFACSKEKQIEKMLYGEWEVTSFMHGANDLTQLYKDSCGCRLIFESLKGQSTICVLKCTINEWNFYQTDTIFSLMRYTRIFSSDFTVSEDGESINCSLGNFQDDSLYHWGFYPLCFGNKRHDFFIQEIKKNDLRLMFTDSSNIPYLISFKKMNDYE